MKTTIITIIRAGDDWVEYITADGNNWSGTNKKMPNAKPGQKWQVMIESSLQYPTGEIVSALLLEAE